MGKLLDLSRIERDGGTGSEVGGGVVQTELYAEAVYRLLIDLHLLNGTRCVTRKAHSRANNKKS
jgi:hypothetical protein